MSRSDRFAPLIPWYVNGTLDDDEHREVEAHLLDCPGCRKLLYHARGQQELAAAGPLESHLEHVRPELLVRFAEDAASVEPETREWIEGRLAECASCRESLERLREVNAMLAASAATTTRTTPATDAIDSPGLETTGASPAIGEARGAESAAIERGGPFRGLWRALSGSLLRPAPALVYLFMLVALPLAWIALERRDTGHEPIAAPLRIVTGSERAERSALGEPATPLLVPLPSRDEPLLLELRTDLRADDVRDLRFELEIARDGEPIWSEPRAPRDFNLDADRASLTLLLRPRRLGVGRFEVLLRVRRPGDPLDGQALFRRTFVVGG